MQCPQLPPLILSSSLATPRTRLPSSRPSTRPFNHRHRLPCIGFSPSPLCAGALLRLSFFIPRLFAPRDRRSGTTSLPSFSRPHPKLQLRESRYRDRASFAYSTTTPSSPVPSSGLDRCLPVPHPLAALLSSTIQTKCPLPARPRACSRHGDLSCLAFYSSVVLRPKQLRRTRSTRRVRAPGLLSRHPIPANTV